MANADFWYTPFGQVKWNLVEDLHTIQQELGLHLGNRLTHRNYHKKVTYNLDLNQRHKQDFL
jgi:hypothetical protein